MIKTESIVPAKPLGKAEARALTERIRKHIDAAWADITRAYEGKAWKAMGYSSWEAYVKAEFDMSRRRSYQLLDQGRVIHAIEEATGENVHHGTQIPERVARELKDDIPAAVEEIKARVEQGDTPEKAAKDIAAERKAEKEKARAERKAEQEKNDALRQASADALPDSIKAVEARKQEAIAAKRQKLDEEDEIQTLRDRIAELEEYAAALEKENEELKAENKKFSEMKAEYEKGGFEEVIRGKDEVIRAQATRIETESREKVRNLNTSEMWRKRAIEAGWSNDVTIDIDTGEIIND